MTALEAMLKKQESAAKAMLSRLQREQGNAAAKEMLFENSLVLADSQFKLTIMATVEESVKLLQEYCNSHYYINPGERSSICLSHPLKEMELATTDYESLLLNLAEKLGRIKSDVKKDWYEYAYE